MKKSFIINLLLFAIITFTFNYNAEAIPAYPHLIEYTQPDGSIITIRLKGDEKINWAETTDSYTILITKEGEYQYATLDSNGDLDFSGIPVSNIEKRSNEEKLFLKNTPKELSYSKAQKDVLKSIWDIKEQRSQKSFPTTGDQNLLCLLMETPDIPFTKTQSDFNALFNQLNYTLDGATGSLKEYYLENSYNQLNLTVDVYGPYTADNNMSYYADDARPLVTEGVYLANDDVNYSNYDSDNDGYVDALYMIFAGYGEEAGGGPNTIWSHAWSISPVYLDGKYISRYACSPELRGNSETNLTRIGVVGHEFGHALGAPDYYDTDYDTGGQFQGTGQWDMMAGGSWNNGGATPAHHNGFTKVIVYNWANATVLSSPASITLNNAAENDDSFYRYNTTTTNEYFLIENREKHLFDSGIPGSGMMIYHVHSGVFDVGNLINATHPQRMYPVAQNATMDPTSTPSSYGNINAASCAWTGTSGKDAFTDESLPSSKSWAGANTSKPITNIYRNGSDKTVYFDFMNGDVDPIIISFNVTNQYDSPVSNAMITIDKDEVKISENSKEKTNAAKRRKSKLLISNESKNNNISSLKNSIQSISSKSMNEPVNKTDKKNKGNWMHWDDDYNANSIGVDEAGIWYAFIKFETTDLAAYDGMKITAFRAYTYQLANNKAMIIYTGNEGSLNEEYYQQYTQIEDSWVEFELDTEFTIDASQELWIGVEVDDPGEAFFPLGVDEATDADGKGNLVTFDGVEFSALSDYGIEGDWNIQAFVEETWPIVLYTDGNGQASYEADSGQYSYLAEKEGYTSSSGNYTVDESSMDIDITLLLDDGEANEDATLADLAIDGTTVEGFDRFIYSYFMELPIGTTDPPIVGATPNDINASINITQAESIPGTAEVLITAEDEITQRSYYVNFTFEEEPLNDDASLSDITIDGTTINGFSPDIYNYSIVLPQGTSAAPVVGATANDSNADVNITQASALPDDATIIVTAEDGETIITYTVSFSVSTNIQETNSFNVELFPNPAKNSFTIKASETINTVQIFNISGQLLLNKSVESYQSNIIISDLSSGIYFVKIQMDNNVTTKKLHVTNR